MDVVIDNRSDILQLGEIIGASCGLFKVIQTSVKLLSQAPAYGPANERDIHSDQIALKGCMPACFDGGPEVLIGFNSKSL